MTDIEFLKYPIGRFQKPERISQAHLDGAATYIQNFPKYLNDTLASFSEIQLNTPYRIGGWTVKQLIHHIADSHMNALIRFKLALTEDNPSIKPYLEAEWAKLNDYTLPIAGSLSMIQAMHEKWAKILKLMNSEDFQKTYYHPEYQKNIPLAEVTLMYEWHSKHHLAHIQHLMLRENWK
ncbi:putative metal-dependent hydrolase [Algoriphagus halophytocola]|uniref:YfiT family bacillithiol transferase n=1 Tax=Algoriphagus halophytocola TaxID=2991499 RepID=UPI0022DE512F|nr:putative metal-dependent hydrolase [Algoriphagus sp. TR-M9]WBL42763.1 putative metal-dependent hydrolase [Algoriphagus sp. TR-M9]